MSDFSAPARSWCRVKEEISSWSALWDDRYAGKILMFDNPRDSFAIAQFLLGQSLNTSDEEDWAEAAALLKQQKPLVQAYVMDRIFDKMESLPPSVAASKV